MLTTRQSSSEAFFFIILTAVAILAGVHRDSLYAERNYENGENSGVSVSLSTPSQPVRVNPRVYGLVCAEMITKGLLDEPEYVQAIAELQLKVLLYPGGSASYWHHPTGKGGLNARPEEVQKSARGEASRWMQQTSGPDRFSQYVELLKKCRAEALFVANIMHGNPEELDAFLQRLQEAKVGIVAVALGQEMHLAPGTVGLGLEEYLRRIKPHIDLLRRKYPGVIVAVPATPVGRVDGRRRERFRGWNQALAQVAGVDAFTQYGWTEFGGEGNRFRDRPYSQAWAEYSQFVVDFPARQVPSYQQDWGSKKKFLMTQWGTHQDQNTPVQGLHLANMYCFLARYNAAHQDYFTAATLSIPLAGVQGLAGRLPGLPYGKKVTLYAAYLYSKPFRYLFAGQSRLLNVNVEQPRNLPALAACGETGERLVYLLNPGQRRPLLSVEIDGQKLSPNMKVRIETAFAAPEGRREPIAVFKGERLLREVWLEPWSVTLLLLSPPHKVPDGSEPAAKQAALFPLAETDSAKEENEGYTQADNFLSRPISPAPQDPRPRSQRPRLTPPAGITEKSFTYKRTPQGELKLIVTFPAAWKSSDRRPTVVFFSGGAWANSLINQFKDRAEYFAGRGMVAIRVDYRAFQSHRVGPDKAVEDARSATRWVRAQATELGIDPERIAAAGSSAGGHLAACTATPVAPDDPQDDLLVSPAPNALMMVNCVADLTGMQDSEKFRQRVAGGSAMAERISPLRHLGKHMPPTLILDGDQDKWFETAKQFVDKLTACGVRAELWVAPGEGHPFTGVSPWREASVAKMDEFLASLGWLTGPPTIPVPATGRFLRYQPEKR